jgi:hypothetical protein
VSLQQVHDGPAAGIGLLGARVAHRQDGAADGRGRGRPMDLVARCTLRHRPIIPVIPGLRRSS